MKRVFAMVLACLMLMTVFAGCSKPAADNELNLVEDGGVGAACTDTFIIGSQIFNCLIHLVFKLL